MVAYQRRVFTSTNLRNRDVLFLVPRPFKMTAPPLTTARRAAYCPDQGSR